MIRLAKLTSDARLLGPVFGQPSYRADGGLPQGCIRANRSTPTSVTHFDRLAGGRAAAARAGVRVGRHRRSWRGKTQAAALVVIALAVCREWPAAPGQVAVALLLAADREQAAVAFRFVSGLIECSAVLRAEVASVTASGSCCARASKS